MKDTMMARKPKAEKQVSVAKALQDALKFCSVASRDIGLPYQSHFQFVNGHVVAFDGVICAAHPVSEDLHCCPSAKEFRAAIDHVTTDLVMTESPDRDRITVKAGKLQTIIPCIYPTEYPLFAPDASIAPLGDSFRDGLSAVSVLATEGGANIMLMSVLMRANTFVCTDGHLLFEYWHGWSVPTLCLPKAIVTALEKIDKPIASFGYSTNSLTIYFADGAWIRSQLVDLEKYPGVDTILADFPAEFTPLPSDFFQALEAVLGQTVDNVVDLEQKYIELMEGNAKYEIDLSPYCAPFIRANIKYLLKAKWATAWNAIDRMRIYFVGGNMRGIMMAMAHEQKRGPDQAQENIPPAAASDDDAVPF